MTLDGSQSQREEISWPKMGILKWPLTPWKKFIKKLIFAFLDFYQVFN